MHTFNMRVLIIFDVVYDVFWYDGAVVHRLQRPGLPLLGSCLRRIHKRLSSCDELQQDLAAYWHCRTAASSFLSGALPHCVPSTQCHNTGNVSLCNMHHCC
jgi:hypothetical protein